MRQRTFSICVTNGVGAQRFKKMNKRFENKYPFDAGRMRHSVQIFTVENTELPDGGTENQEVLYLSTKAGLLQGSTGVVLNDFTQQRIEAGVSFFKADRTFIIRNRSGLVITTAMLLVENNVKYEIVGVNAQDDPKTFIKISCSRLEDLTT